jgi:uncharacterized protein
VYNNNRNCSLQWTISDELRNNQAAIQVCWELTPKNETRELRGLREAMNAFAIEEGFILTNDEERELTFESAKIQVMPVWKWLR